MIEHKKDFPKEFRWVNIVTEPKILLVVIGIIGFTLRLIYLPIDLPLTLDAFLYFWYANDISVTGNLPTSYSVANNGWPIFLSFFFSIIGSENFLDYMILQRLITVILSTITVVPIYYLGTRFFKKHYSLLGATIFAFEPRLILNSILGITEPLFLVLITSSVALFFSYKKKLFYFSFAFAAFAALVRAEGIILIVPLSIFYFLKFRKNRKSLIQFPLLIFLFILILIPVALLRIETSGSDNLISRISNELEIKPESFNKNIESFSEIFKTFSLRLENIVRLGIWSLFPIFVFLFIPMLYAIIRYKNPEINKLLVFTIFISIPALYAISFLPDPRYVLPLFPFFAIFSILPIQIFTEKIRRKNIIIVIIIIILLASFLFLETKKIDIHHEKEALKIARQVVVTTKVINQYLLESSYLPIVGLEKSSDFPITRVEFNDNNSLSNCVDIHECKSIISITSNSIMEFLSEGKDKGLTHLIIDNKTERRPPFFMDVFNHEEDYPFLKKIYDSRDHNFKYHVKIFEIKYPN